MKTTLVLEKLVAKGDIPPAKFYLNNLYGDYIFIHTDSFEQAQEWANVQFPNMVVKSSKLAHRTK